MSGLARLAGIWCNDRDFCEWVAQQLRVRTVTPAEAAEWVRLVCQVDSRAEFDQDRDAGVRFNDLVRSPYRQHREMQDTF